MHGRLVVVFACLLVGGFAAEGYGQTKSPPAKTTAVAKKSGKKTPKKAKKTAKTKSAVARSKAPAPAQASAPGAAQASAAAEPASAPKAFTPAPLVSPSASPASAASGAAAGAASTAPGAAVTPPPPPPPPGFRQLQAVGGSTAPASSAAPAATALVPPQPEPLVVADAARSEPLGLELALKLAMLIPSGNTAEAVAAAESAAEAGKSVFASGALALRYRLPFLERALSLNLEGGYYRLSGEGKRTFVNDPDFGPELSYSWKMDAIPVLFGLGFQLPLPLPVAIVPAAGFAAVHVSSESTYRSAGGEITDAPQSGWALGFYLGVEGTLQLGPGSLLVEVRYMNARTDLGFQDLYAGAYNAEPGDVQGTNLLLGYRYAF